MADDLFMWSTKRKQYFPNLILFASCLVSCTRQFSLVVQPIFQCYMNSWSAEEWRSCDQFWNTEYESQEKVITRTNCQFYGINCPSKHSSQSSFNAVTKNLNVSKAKRKRKLKCAKILSKTPGEKYSLSEVAHVVKHSYLHWAYLMSFLAFFFLSLKLA